MGMIEFASGFLANYIKEWNIVDGMSRMGIQQQEVDVREVHDVPASPGVQEVKERNATQHQNQQSEKPMATDDCLNRPNRSEVPDPRPQSLDSTRSPEEDDSSSSDDETEDDDEDETGNQENLSSSSNRRVTRSSNRRGNSRGSRKSTRSSTRSSTRTRKRTQKYSPGTGSQKKRKTARRSNPQSGRRRKR